MHRSIARTRPRHAARPALAACALLAWACASTPAPASAATTSSSTVDLADAPLFSSILVPANLALTLSVEFPTASTPSYLSSTAYAPTLTFQGYFDPGKCYTYVYQSITPSTSYFKPYSTTATRTCPSATGLPLWSGNYLNWASMQTIDSFRWVLTGGYRSVDTATQTILTKAYHSGQDGGKDFPNRTFTTSGAASVQDATPFNFASLTDRIWGMGTTMLVTGGATGTIGGSPSSASSAAVDYKAQSAYGTGDSLASAGAIYTLYMNVAVCDPSVSLEADCVRYGSNYKPEGLMQKYSSQLRYAAFGYLDDPNRSTQNVYRDGGVMRARMAFIGPTQPVPGAPPTANPHPEWDPSTGVMVRNPDADDASNTSADSATAGNGVTIQDSGVMNYLDKFGNSAHIYKIYDPVSELYYQAVRYFKNQGGVAADSSYAGDGSAIPTLLDGFPVITGAHDSSSGKWTDPIVYRCQKNFILGIGDVNTWRDADLPGSSLYTTAQEPSPQPPEVTSDKTVDVTLATNMVGQLEGLGTLGTQYGQATGQYNTDYIAGLAYDAHTRDIRPDLDGLQTIDTYWLDVLEHQVYVSNNQYYLAAKYGGFDVPSGFSPYAGGNGPSTLPQASWHTNGDTLGTNLRPDHYVTASDGDALKSGLQRLFALIAAAGNLSYGTAFAPPAPNVTSAGSLNYATTYQPQDWTGDVIASTASYASDGTISQTTAWHAASQLDASTRQIVTCCEAFGPPGLPFTWKALTGNMVTGRTYWPSFQNVPGAATQSGANYTAYLRGDRTQELANGGAYRTRDSLLGDIVDSRLLPVGAPAFPYYEANDPGYTGFKAANAGRKTVVYVGANDGMLHAFDGTQNGGKELFAYVPSFVYGTSDTAGTSGLASLGNPSFVHHALVDGQQAEGDVDLANTHSGGGGSGDWHSLLVGGLGKGGQGYYALDVTDPSSWTSEAAVASKVLWEFTDQHMGDSYGVPTIVKTKKYGWVVIVSSGYNNDDGSGTVYFIDPKSGSWLEKVSVPASATPVNLGPVSAFTPDYTDGTADAAYVGDLQGEIWRIDLTGTSGSYAATKIAQLTSPDGTPQPITTRIDPEPDPNSTPNKRYLLVGTGRLLGDSDIGSTQQQSFYAIIDGTSKFGGFYTGATLPGGVTFPVGRSNLAPLTDLSKGVTPSAAQPMGWVFNLVDNGIAARVNIDPQSAQGIVTFAANTPNGDPCNPNGSGTIYVIQFGTGLNIEVPSGSGTGTTGGLGNLADANLGWVDPTGMVTSVGVLGSGGTLIVGGGDASGHALTPLIAPPGVGGFLQLNWRDVPTTGN